MTKDDDRLVASGGAPPRRGIAGPGRKTAPAGTPVNKLPAEVAPAAVTPTSSRPPSGAQDTMSPPRTVGGHTARLFRGEADDRDLDAPDVIEAPRARVNDRAARARAAAAAAAAEEDDEETLARIAAKVKPPPAGARGGTMRMDASDRPPALGPHAVAAARRGPPAAPPPLPPLPVFEDEAESVDEEVPSTARGGTGRDLPEQGSPPLPAAIASLVVPLMTPKPAPVVAPLVSTPIASAPTGEISISGSEFEATGLPPQEVESRWPFAFAVGAVSLAIGSLIPLPFRQYIVPDRGAPAVASGPVSTAPPASATVAAVEPHATVASPHPPTPTLPSALAAVPGIGPSTTASVTRPPAFGSVKIPRPNPTTPKDVF
jgi:hypothetical protein